MTMRPSWPTSLAGRTLLLLLVTASVIYAGAVLAYRVIATDIAADARTAQLAGRLETAVHEIAALEPSARGAGARSLSSPSFRVTWSNASLVDDASAGGVELLALRQQLRTLVDGVGARAIHLHWDEHAVGGSRSVLAGEVELADGSYVVFSAAMLPTAVPAVQGVVIAVSLGFAAIIAVALFLVYGINAPLRRLAQAADHFARDKPFVLPERGPREVVQAERAFNAMQRRIQRLIADRTQALAAVSHDLRTPIARLRLRCDLLADRTLRAEIEPDLTEMEAMIETTLAYLRGEEDEEARRLTDLTALLTTLVDAAIDAGYDASLSGPRHCLVMLRPVSAKRAFANIINNAVTYGGSARVVIDREPNTLRVTIDDDGPGIPEAEIDRVFEPFHRLDAARGRGTGGAGLGLTIARQVFARERGSLTLANRPEGGLRAIVTLPARD